MIKVLVDTNILIYSFISSEEKKHTRCTEILKKLIDQHDLVLSIQNFVELSRVLTEKTVPTVNHEVVQQHITDLSHCAHLIYYTSTTVLRALTIAKHYHLHFFDALLIATMEENSISGIITENEKDFKKCPGITVTNPFR